ncbi:MAG TPA: sugar phosphate isomerase/epimerase [Gemmatimonadales bacterium]
MMRRRDFCRTTVAAAGALAFPGLLPRMRRGAGGLDKIGMQLYSLRNLFEVDMLGTLRQLSAIGYDEVELAGLGQRTVTEVRAALDKAHMSAPSAHTPLQAIRENLSLVLGNAKILEVKYIVVPWIDEEFRNPAGYRQVAAMLNQAGNVARRAGHLIAYHNQDYDFAEVNGERGYDIMLEETDPEVVKLELDLYWIRKGGGDAIEYLKKYSGRFHMVHVKDMATDGTQAIVGTGVIDWKAIIAAADKAGVKHYFVELDDPVNPIAFARSSYDYLRELRY